MQSVFGFASAFNQDLSAWYVSSVTNVQDVFWKASAFNQDISAWDVSSITTMRFMFYSASAFNQDLSTWHVPVSHPWNHCSGMQLHSTKTSVHGMFPAS
eukprot:scaffold138275_cov80-Attheya_sp.AAC.2